MNFPAKILRKNTGTQNTDAAFFFLIFKVKFILLCLLLRLVNISILYIYQGKETIKVTLTQSRCFNFLSFIFSFSLVNELI